MEVTLYQFSIFMFVTMFVLYVASSRWFIHKNTTSALVAICLTGISFFIAAITMIACSLYEEADIILFTL